MAGSLFIISAPSGAGKSTILKQILATIKGVTFSVSHTTRPPRKGEMDGREYHFVDQSVFTRMIEQKAFLEWAEVHGNRYGTSREAVQRLTAQGIDVLLDIDVQGARQIRNSGWPDARFLFIIPPSMEELKQRLLGRGTDTEDVIRLRLQNAVQEMTAQPEYDLVILNDRLDAAVDTLRSIIIAERSRTRRSRDGASIPPA
jgi:guanylate kinase